MSEWAWVLVAFGLTWAVLIGYTLYLNGRLERSRAALRAANAELEVGS